MSQNDLQALIEETEVLGEMIPITWWLMMVFLPHMKVLLSLVSY
jgi:hypothetical protein